MIGTVEFIKCAGSLATAECPIITADSEMDDYVVAVYSNVKFIEDMRQTLVMPSFDGWSECNMVRFKESGSTNPWIAYYWITDAVRSSTSRGCTNFMLEFNAPTTMLKKGDTVNGQWLRSPVNFTPWKQQNVISGTMGYEATDRRFELSALPTANSGKMLWVSITATKTPDNTQGSLSIYGFPIIVGSNYIIPGYAYLLYIDDDSTYGYSEAPTLKTIKEGMLLSGLGLTAEEVQDISITSGCPYPCSYDASSNKFHLGSPTVKATHIKYTDGGSTKTSLYPMYYITGGHGYSTPAITEYATDKIINVTDMEQTCGQFNIIDTNGSVIYNIPSNWIQNGKIRFTTRVICDFSQIYWRIEVKDTSNKTLGLFQINEGHVPYIGTQWDSYRAYSMSFDRESVQFANDQAKSQAAADAITSLTKFSLADVGGSAVRVAAGVASAYFGYEQTTKANNFNQNLSERKTAAQPGNAYGLNYGLGYAVNAYKTPNAFVISMPVGITEDIFNEFIENFGYANEGEYEMPINYGFYQGTIYTSPTMTGPRLVEMINLFNSGVRLIKPSGNVKT